MAALAPGGTCYITARRAFHETETFAVLTVFVKGVPDESDVQLTLDGSGQQLEALITVPGRGVCRFAASLTAAVKQPVAILISPSKLKVELKMQTRWTRRRSEGESLRVPRRDGRREWRKVLSRSSKIHRRRRG